MLWRADSLEKTLMLGKTEGKRSRGHQRNRGLNGITDSVETNLSKFLETGKDRGAQRAAVHGGCKESDTTEQLNNSQRKISQTWENFSRMLSRSRIIRVSTFCNTPEFLAGCFLHLFLPLARAEEVTRQIKRDWASAQESDLFKTPEAVSKWCWQLLRPRAGIWPPPKFPGPPTTPPLAGAAPETRSPRTGPVSPSRQWVCVTPQLVEILCSSAFSEIPLQGLLDLHQRPTFIVSLNKIWVSVSLVFYIFKLLRLWWYFSVTGIVCLYWRFLLEMFYIFLLQSAHEISFIIFLHF